MKTSIHKDKISSFLIDGKYRVLRHLVLQFIVLTITIGVFFDAPDKLNLSLNRFYGWISYFLFINMLVYFNTYVLFPRLLAKNKMILYAISVVAFTFFALFIMMILQDLFYDIGVTHQEPSAIALFLSISSSLFALFLFLGGISAVLTFKNWIISNQRATELKAATSESELKFLKNQINPHFLFNMLNNANILVDEDPDMSSYILKKLDELLQYQLNDSLQDQVGLNADIRFLINYLELEKTRRDTFEYTIRQEGNMDKIQVAPLLFIPFVENAVKHNSNSEENSYVHISFCLDQNKLTFICKNSVSGNIPENTAPKKDGGLGLTNIRRRLDLLFYNHYSLVQTKTATEYTVNLQLKL